MLPISPQNILDPSLLQRMSPADFKFARQQLNLIYSRQMSKVSLNLQKRQKVLLNLETQEQIKEEILKQEEMTLINKLQKAQLKRKLINDKRSRIREIKELKWMERKERAESVHEKEIRQSEKRQKEIVRDLQDYRNNKNNRSNLIQKSYHHSPQPYEQYYEYDYESTQKYNDKKKQPQKHEKQRQKDKLPDISKSIITEMKYKGLKLNRSILEHQKKKRRMHEEKQDEILKEYIHRIQNIERKRDDIKKSRSEQNKKLEPSEHRVPKSKERQFRDRSRNRNQGYTDRTRLDRDKIEDYQHNKYVQDEHEFNERTNLLENIEKQTLKTAILKQIKTKVKEHKLIAQR